MLAGLKAWSHFAPRQGRVYIPLFRSAGAEWHVTMLIGAGIDLFTQKYSNEATGETVSSFILNLFGAVFSQKEVIKTHRKWFLSQKILFAKI